MDKPDDKGEYVGMPLLSVVNLHMKSCGKPPHIQPTKTQYCAYAQNKYGEQMIFLYDYETQAAILYHGDADWDKPHPVLNHTPFPVLSLILSREETAWLRAVWTLATGEEPDWDEMDKFLNKLRGAAQRAGIPSNDMLKAYLKGELKDE